MEITQIQTKERIPRQQAMRKLLRLNLHPELICSHAVKNTSNRIPGLVAVNQTLVEYKTQIFIRVEKNVYIAGKFIYFKYTNQKATIPKIDLTQILFKI